MDRHEDAVADLTRAIELVPENAWVLGTRGQVYQAHRPLRGRGRRPHPGNRTRPELAYALAERGETYWLMGRHGDAIDAYDQAIALDPHDVGAHENKGIFLATIGDFDRALAELDIADRLAPTGAGVGRT